MSVYSDRLIKLANYTDQLYNESLKRNVPNRVMDALLYEIGGVNELVNIIINDKNDWTNYTIEALDDLDIRINELSETIYNSPLKPITEGTAVESPVITVTTPMDNQPIQMMPPQYIEQRTTSIEQEEHPKPFLNIECRTVLIGGALIFAGYLLSRVTR